MSGLTIKQEKFAIAYVRLGNASAAYREVYSAKKATDKTINEEACRLLADPKIAARAAELLKPAIKTAQLTADRVLEHLAEAAYSTPSEDIKWSDKLNAIDKSMKYLGLFEKDNRQQAPVMVEIELLG